MASENTFSNAEKAYNNSRFNKIYCARDKGLRARDNYESYTQK